MTSIFLALLPVFLVIVVGFLLRRFNVVREQEWAGLDHVCYYVLFPVIIFKEIAGADFTGIPVFQMAGSMAAAVVVMVGTLTLFHRPLMAILRIDGPQFTSLAQGAGRWHTFIAFGIIALQFGPKALPLGAVGAATMNPLLNIMFVLLLSHFAQKSKVSPVALLRSIVANPFVFSSLGGIAWQVTGLELPPMALQVLDIIGRGGLGLALLTVGAGLRIGEAISSWPPVALAVVLKLLVMPVLMATMLTIMGVQGEAFAVAVLCGSVPTGSGAYVLARLMGGDAPMVANMLTLQVIFAAVTIPLVLYLIGVAH